MTTQTIVAFSYTKLRTKFGMVGIEIDSQKRIAYVRLAKEWSRDEMNSIPAAARDVFNKVQWHLTFADQLIGQHLIRSLEKKLGFQVQAITTQKNLKDPENIELLKVMDITEMTQLTLSLKQDHLIQFPPKPTEDMSHLISQMEMFTEYVTEAGTVSYYAPGEEPDHLTRALMICCFVGRTLLQHGYLDPIFLQGSKQDETADESFNKYFADVLDDDYGGLSRSELNRTSKFRIIKRTQREW